jgi:Ni/Fe-hydrogenase subunit HybB-like protein
MEIILVVEIVIIGGWFWRSRQYDKQTLMGFGFWILSYQNSISPFQSARMAVAFLAQSIHMAQQMGIVNNKQRKIMTNTFKQAGATMSVSMLLGRTLHVVIDVLGENGVQELPARTVGALMVLTWMTPREEQEYEIRRFLFQR